MENLELEERYLVVSHNPTGRPNRIVGSAYKRTSDGDFTLYFRLFPGVRYYIARNRDLVPEYLIFSGCEKGFDGMDRHFCKIGSGIYLADTHTIQLHIPDLRQFYYMKLTPEDYHCDADSVA